MRLDLIALDLDGTLLDREDNVSPRNRRAIHLALAQGVRIVLVTGRGVDTPIRISRELNLNLPVICCHGALTKDFHANKILGHIPVPLAYAKPIVAYAEEQALSIAVYLEEQFYRLQGAQVLVDDMTSAAWRTVPNISEILHTAPTFIRALGKHSVASVVRRFGDLPLSFRRETWSVFVECAILNPEASKQRALARLCADFQIPRERVMAVGDSPNDVAMLRWAATGVAMGNAQREVKEAVPYTTGTNDDDGVAHAIEHFLARASRRKVS